MADLELGSKHYAEIREELWALELSKHLKRLGKNKSDIQADPKSSDWKVAIATLLKRKMLRKNPWISRHLNMGSGPSISRYCSELSKGKRPHAKEILKRLDQ